MLFAAYVFGALVPMHCGLAAAAAAIPLTLIAPRKSGRWRWPILLVAAGVLGAWTAGSAADEETFPTGPIYKGRVTAVTISGAMIRAEGNSRLWVPGRFVVDGVMRGDRLEVAGWRQGRFVSPSLLRIRPASGAARKLRGELAELMERRLSPSMVSAVSQTLLLGYRARMPRRARDAFRRGGVTHLLAVSGMHVGMVALIALLLLRGVLGRGWASTATAVVIVASYAVLTGLRPSAVRASVMAIAALVWLQAVGGSPGLLWLWGAAGVVVLAADPAAVHDAGAQMSFGAVLALILAGRTFDLRPPPLAWMANGIYAGLVVTVALAPIVTACYGEVRPLGPLLTVLSLPLVIGVMALSPLALIPVVGGAFGRLLEWTVWLWLRVVEAVNCDGMAVGGVGSLLAWICVLGLLIISRRWRGLHLRLR